MSNSQPTEPIKSGIEYIKPIPIVIECPLKKEYPTDYIPGYDTVLTVKRTVNQKPELCHYTSYHFELVIPNVEKSIILNDFTDLSKIEIVNGSRFVIVMDNYNLSSVKQQIANLREKLRHPPNSINIDMSTVELPEVVKRYNEALRQAAIQLAEEEKVALENSKKNEKPSEEVHVPDTPALANVPKEGTVLPLPKPDEGKEETIKEIKEKVDAIDVEGIKASIHQQLELFPSLLQKIPLENIPVVPDLTQLFASKTSTDIIPTYDVPICLKSISHSGWNPPPPNRKLLGDLLYLDIETLEGETFFVSCTVAGFYVNKSRKDCFDPTPSARPCHSPHLLGLLNQLSVQFRNQYKLLIQNAAENAEGPNNNLWDTLTKISIPDVTTTPNWCEQTVDDEKIMMGLFHPYDLDRAEGDLLNRYSLDNQLSSTNWNEDYQSAVDLDENAPELPPTAESIEVYRARGLYIFTINFTKACTEIIQGIIDETIQPFNPSDPPKAHFYFYNNIVISQVADTESQYKNCGGDEAAYIYSNQELASIRILNKNDLRNPHTLLTTIVDFKGRRFVAQAAFPGLFQTTPEQLYGSLDLGSTIAYDETTHTLVSEIYKALGIGAGQIHPIGPIENQPPADAPPKEVAKIYKSPTDTVNIYGSVRSQVLRASDGRLYFLCYLSPHDIVHQKARKDKNLSEEVCMIRNELVQHYYLHMCEIVRDEAEKKAKETNKDIDVSFPEIALNLNIGGTNVIADPPEKIKADTEVIENLCLFMKEMQAGLITDLLRSEVACADSSTLVLLLHNRGINLRYLGDFASSISPDLTNFTNRAKFFVELCETEMIARAVKHLLREIYLTDSVSAAPAFMLAQLFNILFGTPGETVSPTIVNEGNVKSKGKERKNQVNLGVISNKVSQFVETDLKTITPEQVWEKIESFISKHFIYQLRIFTKEATEVTFGYTQRLAVLRRICMVCGIKIQARNYEFGESNPFTPDDIIDVFPVVKNCIPTSPLPTVQNMIDQACTFIGQGQYSVAFQLVQQCILAMLEITGYAHEDMTICLSTLSVILNNLGDLEGAINHQKRSLKLSTSLYGEASPKLVRILESLAVFYHQAGKTAEAISTMKRAIYILDIVGGDHNIYSVSAYIRLGTMARDISHLPLALAAYKEAVRRARDDPFGQMEALKPLALTAAITGYFAEAVTYQETYYNLCKGVFGDDNDLTKEGKSILERYLRVKAAMGDFKIE